MPRRRHDDDERRMEEGLEAPPRGELSILTQPWNRAQSERWAATFLRREERREAGRVRAVQKASLQATLRAEAVRLRQELSNELFGDQQFCVSCRAIMTRGAESPRAWANRQRCDHCRIRKVNFRDLVIHFCRHCGGEISRAEHYKRRALRTWPRRTRCDRCADTWQRFNQLILERLREWLNAQAVND